MKPLARWLVLAGLLAACTPASASPPSGFRLVSDTVRITATPCAGPVSCRYVLATDSTFSAVVSTQTVSAGAVIAPVSLTCPAPLASVTVYGRAYGVSQSGIVGSAFVSDRQTITCPDAPPGTVTNFRIILQVVGG